MAGTVCDLYLDWHTGADGNAITTAIAAGSCRPTNPANTPGVSPGSTLTMMRIETDSASPVAGLVLCDGVEYNLDDTVQGVIYDHNGLYEDVVYASVSSAPSVMSMGFLFKTTLAAAWAWHALCGINGSGEWALLAPRYFDAQQHLYVHTSQGYSATAININNDTWYWVTIQYNRTAGYAYLAVYLASTMVQVGSTVSLAFGTTPPTVSHWQVGQSSDQGNQEAANSWFGPVIFDWTDGTFPLLPGAAASPQTISGAGGIPSAEAFGTPNLTSGPYSVRFDIDASNSLAQFAQYFPAIPDHSYRASFWYKTGVGKTLGGFVAAVIGGVTKYLQPDGSWKSSGDPGYLDYTYSGSLTNIAWTESSFVFQAPPTFTGNLRFGVYNISAASSSLYVDDAALYHYPGTKLNPIIKPSAIGTHEAFGTAVMVPAIGIVGHGIPSAEAFGTPAMLLRYMAATIPTFEVVPTGAVIASAGPGPRWIYPTGIVPAEAFGTAALQGGTRIYPEGIPTGEILPGGARMIASIVSQGIPTLEAFGIPVLFNPAVNVISAEGIPSAEAFGTAQLNSIVKPSGIPGAETFGTAQFNWRIYPVEIGSMEAFGTAIVGLTSTTPIYVVVRPRKRIRDVYRRRR